ncbi:retrotransposon protein, putative, ty3-gypsy subclass [Tanacetum coccineum]
MICQSVQNLPLTFDEQCNTTYRPSPAFAMNNLKIDNLTKEIVVGPAYNLLKGTCKSYMELYYTMEEGYRALSEQIDWNNPKGHRCPYDLTKPLPMQMSSQGRQIVPADFFFNNDLEYLRGGSNDKKYTASTIKSKAARYELKGIEDMVPNLWIPVKVVYDIYALLGISYWRTKRYNFYDYTTKLMSKHDVYLTKRILSIISVKVNEWYEYGHLDEIVVKRADQKLYTFKEGDFKRLHLNDIEDMGILLEKADPRESRYRRRDAWNMGIRIKTNREKNMVNRGRLKLLFNTEEFTSASGPNKEIDDAPFTYGFKQSKPSESDARSSDFNSCESNCSEETHESMPVPIINEPKVVVPINAARKLNTVKPIVNNARPKAGFHESVSPFRKGKRETAIKSSAVVNGDPIRHYLEPRLSIKSYRTNGLLNKDVSSTHWKQGHTLPEIQYFNGAARYLLEEVKGSFSTDAECLVLFVENVRLPDESSSLTLESPDKTYVTKFQSREHCSSGGLACLIAKAIIDESNKWHRRLGHVNFKNLNKIMKGNLVRGLPSKIFQND